MDADTHFEDHNAKITSLKQTVEEKMAKLWEFAGFKVYQ